MAPGRIVWVKRINKGKERTVSSEIEGKDAEARKKEGARHHPGVILRIDDKIGVLSITSWDGKTVEEKWAKGKGVEYQKHYLLVDHKDEESQRAREEGKCVLSLQDGKVLRKRCWVSVRDDVYEYEVGDLALYTDREKKDDDFFVAEESLKMLSERYNKELLSRLSK